jgi:hypothetical protein
VGRVFIKLNVGDGSRQVPPWPNEWSYGRCHLFPKNDGCRWFLYTDEDIRKLCLKVLNAQGEEFYSAIGELRLAFRSRIENLSNFALATIFKVNRPGDSDSSNKQA